MSATKLKQFRQAGMNAHKHGYAFEAVQLPEGQLRTYWRMGWMRAEMDANAARKAEARDAACLGGMGAEAMKEWRAAGGYAAKLGFTRDAVPGGFHPDAVAAWLAGWDAHEKPKPASLTASPPPATEPIRWYPGTRFVTQAELDAKKAMRLDIPQEPRGRWIRGWDSVFGRTDERPQEAAPLPPAPPAVAPCTIAEELRESLLQRSELGVAKYGQTLSDNPAAMVKRLNHMREEMLDGAMYATWAIRRVEGWHKPSVDKARLLARIDELAAAPSPAMVWAAADAFGMSSRSHPPLAVALKAALKVMLQEAGD